MCVHQKTNFYQKHITTQYTKHRISTLLSICIIYSRWFLLLPEIKGSNNVVCEGGQILVEHHHLIPNFSQEIAQLVGSLPLGRVEALLLLLGETDPPERGCRTTVDQPFWIGLEKVATEGTILGELKQTFFVYISVFSI